MIAVSRTALFAIIVLAVTACSETADSGAHTDDSTATSHQAALLTASCSGCHAAGGAALVDIYQLDANAISASMRQYRSEADGTTVMHRLSRGFSEDDVAIMADYIGRREGR